MGKTGFEKLQQTILGEAPIDLSVKTPTQAPNAVAPVQASVRPSAKENKKSKEKGDQEKEYQVCAAISYDTRYKINEIKFKTGLNIKLIIAEAIDVYYQKKIEESIKK